MSDSKNVLAICAHPDDAEICCVGTLILLARQGWNVHIATLTCGDCGSVTEQPNVIATKRRGEAEAAAKLIGGTYHMLGGIDLRVFDDDVMRGATTALIRKVNPDCIITHYPIDYMPDHEAASAVTRSASFAAPIPNYVVGPSAAYPATPGVIPIYYFMPLGGVDYFGNVIKPDFYVDITSSMDEKVSALSCHASQRDWLRKQSGIDQYIEQLKVWDAEMGQIAKVPYAEGFSIHKGYSYPQTPLIQDAVGDKYII